MAEKTSAVADPHRVVRGAQYCSCHMDAVTCQQCGQQFCGTMIVRFTNRNFCSERCITEWTLRVCYGRSTVRRA